MGLTVTIGRGKILLGKQKKCPTEFVLLGFCFAFLLARSPGVPPCS